MRQKTIHCVGYSRLPAEMTAADVYKHLGVGLEVDPETSEVIDAAITLVSGMGQRFFASTVMGRRLDDGIEAFLEDIEATYFGTGKKAILHATREAYRRFIEFREFQAGGQQAQTRHAASAVNLNSRRGRA